MSTGAGSRPIYKSLREYARGIAGGIIFSLPLLYTMEMWAIGATSHAWRLLVYVGLMFLLLLGYNRFAGLRADAGWGEIVIDTIEEIGIGLVVATIVLWLLGRIDESTGFQQMIGQITLEAMTVAIGVSVGTAQLGAKEPQDKQDQAMKGEDPESAKTSLQGQLVVSLCGAVLFASNVAPTEEIHLIAAEASPLRLVLLSFASMLVGTVILYYSAFVGADRYAPVKTIWGVLAGAVSMYAVAFVAALGMLWVFGQLDGLGFYLVIAEGVVLGAVATLGASAGRLLIQ